MGDVWTAGSLGTLTLEEVHQAIRDRLGLGEQQLAAYMTDLWREYLGTANTELIEYARQLRPRYRTGILSNSFVGAREREQAASLLPSSGTTLLPGSMTGPSRSSPSSGNPPVAILALLDGNHCRCEP